MADDIRPPIPVTCARRPTVGGLVIPVVNVPLADGGVDFRARHQAKYAECWQDGRCQVCDGRITGRAVLLTGAHHLAERRVDEAPLCVPCALYTTRACPMVAGRQEQFASRQRVSEGKRGKECATEGCDCGGWANVEPGEGDTLAEQPAHPWYALYVRPGAWQVTASIVRSQCSDKGCWHERPVINGALLTGMPLKVVLVSAPGEGRAWRTLTAAEVAKLIPAPPELPLPAKPAPAPASRPARSAARSPEASVTPKQLKRAIAELEASRKALRDQIAELEPS